MKQMRVTSVFVTAFLVTAVLAGLVPAAVGADGGDALFAALQPYVDIYNANVENIPVINSLIGAERIRGEIALNDGSSLVVSIVTDADAKVTSFEKGEISDPTIKASTDENTVRSIITAADPIAAFQDALNSGAIHFKGVGMGSKVKVGLLKVGLKLAGFFT
ncbi:MAG: hypothetical protein JW878_01025 [Methanomicrobia archaeon]|nr:hypothetical protein [Methanomicrobia archaeon]